MNSPTLTPLKDLLAEAPSAYVFARHEQKHVAAVTCGVLHSLTQRFVPLGFTEHTLRQTVEGWIGHGIVPESWLELVPCIGPPARNGRRYPHGSITTRALVMLWCACNVGFVLRARALASEILDHTQRDTSERVSRHVAMLWHTVLDADLPPDTATFGGPYRVLWPWKQQQRNERGPRTKALLEMGVSPTTLRRKVHPRRHPGDTSLAELALGLPLLGTQDSVQVDTNWLAGFR